MDVGVTPSIMTNGGARPVRRVRAHVRTGGLRLAGRIVLVGVAYFVVAKLGLQLAFVKGNVTPVFPAAGLAVAALALGGLRLWPAIALGALAAHLTTDVAVPTAMAMSAGGPLAAVAAAGVLRSPRHGFSMRFGSVQDAVVFIAGGVVLPATISAACGVTALLAGGDLAAADYPVAFGSWWVGDGIGAMVAGSLILAWASPPMRAPRPLGEMLALLALPIALTVLLFTQTNEGEALLLPLLVLAAVRLETRWTVLGVTVVSLVAAWATANGRGPFVEATENESLVQLSLFLAAVTLTTLVLSSAVAERDRAGDQAHHDDLTGLPNRLQLLEQLQAAIARRQPFGLLFADLDGLKRVNDTLGHDSGDQLLVQVAARIRAGLRSGDVAARLAGDEFTILAFQASEVDDVIAAGERLAESLAAPFDVFGTSVTITASIGAAVGDEHTDAVSLLRAADAAMYRAKRAGGNRVVVLSE